MEGVVSKVNASRVLGRGAGTGWVLTARGSRGCYRSVLTARGLRGWNIMGVNGKRFEGLEQVRVNGNRFEKLEYNWC